MDNIIQWFTTGGWEAILIIVGGIMIVGSAISGLTATPKDDAFFSKLRDILNRFGFLRFADEPGTVKMPGAKKTHQVVTETQPQ